MSQVAGQGSQVELLRCVPGVQKIEAIKAIRRHTGLGLKSAKHTFEECWSTGKTVALPVPSEAEAHALAERLLTLGVVSRVGNSVYDDLARFEPPGWWVRRKGTFEMRALRHVNGHVLLEGTMLDGTLDLGDDIAYLLSERLIVLLPVLKLDRNTCGFTVQSHAETDDEFEFTQALVGPGDHLPVLAPSDP
ncbi:MAG: ribosomal protein L7/L12 [Bacteroidota bacterium]